MNWQPQRLCTDVGEYELVVERQKQSWSCSQKRDVWKWNVVYHGTVVVSGLASEIESAKKAALASVPGR